MAQLGITLIVLVGCRPEPAPQPPRLPADAAVGERGSNKLHHAAAPIDAGVAEVAPPMPNTPVTVIKQSEAAPRSCESTAIAGELERGSRALASALASAKLVPIDPVELPHELAVRPGPTPRDPPEWADSDARFAVRAKATGDVVEYTYRGKRQRGVFVNAQRWVLVTRGNDAYLAIPSSILLVPCTSKQLVRACSSFAPGRIIAIPASTTYQGVLALPWEHVQVTVVGGGQAACPA